MENNEQDTAPVAEKNENGQEETKDWKAEALKYKAIAERKEKKLQQAEGSQEPTVTNKPNQEQSIISRDEVIFFSKGGTEEDLKIARKIADNEGISLLAAMEDDFYKHKVEQRKAEEQAKRNQLRASGGSPSGNPEREKTPGEMTPDEHRAWAMKKMNQ